MANLVNMAATKAEMKAERDRYKNGPSLGESPYRYGLTIRLDKLSLKKLGLKPGDLAVGQTVKVYAKCEVSEVRQNNTKSQDDASVELQIEALCVEEAGDDDAVDVLDRALEDLEDDE